MHGLAFEADGIIKWVEHSDPGLMDAEDVIMRVSTTTICGTDVHVIKGGVPDARLGVILGHEGVGVVEEVGSAVRGVAVGDRVLATAMSACGYCSLCKVGMQGVCRNGGWILGHLIDGTQAEYVRIPFANNALYRISDGLSDEDVLFLTDIFVTGYEVGVLRGAVTPGDTVVIIGGGPVGLATAMTSRLFSPANVIVVEPLASRREKALEVGASHSVRPEEAPQVVEELTGGVGADVSIEAAGFPSTFELATCLVRPGGHVANIGVHEKPAMAPLQRMWAQQLTVTTGIPSAASVPQLMRAIGSGLLDPKALISHRFALSSIEEAYKLFMSPEESQAMKIVLHAG